MTKVYKYIMFELKKHREVMFDDTEYDTKFEGKLTCAFKNDMINLANFHQSTRKSQNWDFYGMHLSKVGNVWV